MPRLYWPKEAIIDIPHPLALDLVAAAGLRNLVAHQYGAVEWARIYAAASSPDLDDLEAFCEIGRAHV